MSFEQSTVIVELTGLAMYYANFGERFDLRQSLLGNGHTGCPTTGACMGCINNNEDKVNKSLHFRLKYRTRLACTFINSFFGVTQWVPGVAIGSM
jgi:hypothetical protein